MCLILSVYIEKCIPPPTGADDPLPLNQVPKSCGYTMRKSALDFVLAVSYDGCNIIREVSLCEAIIHLMD